MSRGSGAAIIRALQAEGVAACGKHFPGHGDTSTDSHLELPLVEHPPERLRDVEFVPFRAAIAAEVATIMTAHVLVPALDEKRPATLSQRIVTGLLREELSIEGVILSDDLEMKAIASDYPVPAAAVLAIEAGCDGVLICSGDHDTQAAALEALVHAVEAAATAVSRASRTRSRRSGAPRSGSCRRLPAPNAGLRDGAAAGARPRRASRDRRRDGALRVMLKPRALGRAIASPSSRRPARSTATSSTAASRKSGGSASSRSTTTRCSRGSRYRGGAAGGPRRRDSSALARSVDRRRHRRPRRLRQRAAAAAARSRS